MRDLLIKYSVSDYFVFDMSLPDSLAYLDLGMNVFLRRSEYENMPSLYERACGIWLDELQGPWITKEVIESYLAMGKFVCIVSPELHKRPYKSAWEQYRAMLESLPNAHLLMLCTDFPKQAREFFASSFAQDKSQK